MTVECPDCGEEFTPGDEETTGEDPPITVCRRQQGFSGDITSLLEMHHFAYMVRLPCGCEILTVN